MAATSIPATTIGKPTSISISDTKQFDNYTGMSLKTSLVISNTNVGQQVVESTNDSSSSLDTKLKCALDVSVSAIKLLGSTKQLDGAGILGDHLESSEKKQQQQTSVSNSKQFDNQQVDKTSFNATNQRSLTSSRGLVNEFRSTLNSSQESSEQSNLPWVSAYTMPMMYSAFGMDLNYNRDGIDLSHSPAQQTVQASSAPLYNDQNVSVGDSHLIRAFHRFSVSTNDNNDANSLFDNCLFDGNNHSPACDITSGPNMFLSERLSTSSGQMKASESGNQRSYQDNTSAFGTSKTYSSVLHESVNMTTGYPYSPTTSATNSQSMELNRLFATNNNNNTNERISLDDQADLFPTTSQHEQQQMMLNQYQFLDNQAHALNEFLSTTNQQSYHILAPQHSQTNSSSNHLLGASVSASQASRNPTIGQQRTLVASGSDSKFSLKANQHLSSASHSSTRRRNRLPFFTTNNFAGDNSQHGFRIDTLASQAINQDASERFSRKVFVGGLPPDIDEEEIKTSFRRFGTLVVDWPHKAESKSYFPPKGYAFLLFHEEASVRSLIDSCFQEGDKLYLCVSSPTIKDKPVQIRPWRLSDTDFVLDSTLALDARKTVFVGGVPRPLKSSELAIIMNKLYGGVCYAGIDTDPELKYPKGAGRVAFSNHQSYIDAISARFVHIRHGEIEKRVEVKPYVLDDQFCDECHGARCANKYAPFFCANITCLRYYCEDCWSSVHSQLGREFHKPLVKEGGDRPRNSQSLRW